MINDRTASVFSEDGSDLYPHFKVTVEDFPRVLATRRDEEDGAEYFGAFLTKTASRILIEFLNSTFRLRTCEIEIDGNFPVPCTQFYRKRCLAPCVTSLCSRDEYLEMTLLVRVFLANDRGLFVSKLTQLIEIAAEALDFEQAASWRDILLAAEKFWSNPKLNVWLDDTTDTYATDETIAGEFIYLVTQRGRRILGRKVFRLLRGGGLSPDEALERIVSSFYRFHLPREIRVSIDFAGRKKLITTLTKRFGREARIVLVRPDKQLVTSMRAFNEARSENELDYVKQKATPRQITGELKRAFDLAKIPSRIEAFDVAHISGTSFVAASSVWHNGRFVTEEYRLTISDKKSEIRALAAAVVSRLLDARLSMPDLILIDGGRTQLNAVQAELVGSNCVSAPLVGAVKPARKHSAISHFLTTNGERIDFDAYNPAHSMLQLLRDAAHDLANRAHRDVRDMVHHYELSSMLPSINEAERRHLFGKVGSIKKIADLNENELAKLVPNQTARQVSADLKKYRSGESEAVFPFIVPISYVAENGDADDLRPIDFR